MIISFLFWQHCWLESEELISGKSFVEFDADFEDNIKICKIFQENINFPSFLFFNRKFPIQK